MTNTIEQENTYTSGVYSKRPIAIARGSGALVWDEEGREYIDCTAGYGVANIGHGRAEIATALAAQAQRLISCPEIFYNDARARLLERLARLTPEGLDSIFLCNSGTEAIEGAIKFARLATGRTGIIATLRGFHGRTMGALSVTWEPRYREPFAPLVPGVQHVRYNDLAAAEAAIDAQTAAVIVELVQGEGGVHIASDEYVHGLVRLCSERGALLIIDEVQTGFGRTGRLFACNHYDIQPDILCLAKSLAGGVPMGAVCLGQRVMAGGRITRGVHGSSFGGNPLACAAAQATLDIIEQERLPERAARLGEHALTRLRALNTPRIREARGRGLLLGIELNQRALPFIEALGERGVLALQAGPNVIRLLPPLVITEAQLDHVLDVLEDVLSTATNAANGGGATGNVSTVSPTIVPDEAALLQRMLTIPSYSGQEQALARYLVEQARLMGLHAWMDEAGNFLASTHPREQGEREPSIALLGHMDTVRGYISPRLVDGLLYGRGAVDAKGPLAAFLCATARLASRLEHVQYPIVVIGAVEEESATSRGARAVVDRYRPSACIIGEPSGSQAITLGYKGRLLVDYCLACSIAHSSGPQQNSAERAIAFWNRVSRHASAWNEQHAASSTFAALLPSLRDVRSEQDGFEERTNLRVGYRLPPNYDIAELRAQLEKWAGEDDARLTFAGEELAFQAERAMPLARALVSAIRVGGGQPSFKLKTGTSDMNVVGPVWGQNIVAYGPGDSRLDHTPQEHIRLDEYRQAIDVLERALATLTMREATPVGAGGAIQQ